MYKRQEHATFVALCLLFVCDGGKPICDRKSKNVHSRFTVLNEKAFTFRLASVYYPFKTGHENHLNAWLIHFFNSRSTEHFFPKHLDG